MKFLEPVTDNHIHIDLLNGLGIEAVKRFKRAGGTCLFVVNKMSKDLGVTIKKGSDFQEVFERSLRIQESIVKEVGLEVHSVIGVHPAEFVLICRDFGVDRALEISMEAVDIAGKLIENKSAVAIGEMGRPHFQVESDIFNACNELLFYAMCRARDLDCAIQLHTESSSKELFQELKDLSKKAGLNPVRVIKHFSGPIAESVREPGLMPSLLATKENVLPALKNHRFLLESDYIDDLSRPGVVIGPKSVPRLTKKLVADGLLSPENAVKIHNENIEVTYGIEIGNL